MTEQKKTRKQTEKHGMTGTPIYKIWASMKDRCRREPNYVNKKIQVCKEWEQSFLAFYRDMGERPTEKHQLDRRDPWGDYCKDNCRWLLPKENSRNKTNQRMLTLNNETLCLTEWAEKNGLKPETIESRLLQGWTIEEALTIPTRKTNFSEDQKESILKKLGNNSLVEKIFGRLTVVKLHARYKNGENAWLCTCECGKAKVARTGQLQNGLVMSCGCDLFYDSQGLRRLDIAPRLPTQTPEYRVWSGIKQRCQKHKGYIERGITIFETWEKSYEAFLEYLTNTIGLKPAKGYALDRLDNNKGYIPGNIRWVTVKENNRNTSSIRPITYQNKTQPLSVWAEELGINSGTLRMRLDRGWSIEKALTTPLQTK